MRSLPLTLLLSLSAITSLFPSLSPPLFAREFYALLAADTITEVKKASRKDLSHMKEEMRQAAAAIGATFNVTELYGKSLTAGALQNWLSQKQLSPDDVILFYYTGHGLRTEKSTSIWPYLYLPSQRELVDTNKLIAFMKERGAGLSILLADCCNNFIRQTAVQYSMSPKTMPPFLSKKIQSKADAIGYRRLFRNAKGIIIASGSVPGKRSWATPKGGIFTNAFLYSLHNELDEQFPAWDHILNKTKSFCIRFQKPQYHTQVSYN